MARVTKDSTEEMIIYNNEGEIISNYSPDLLNVIKKTVAKGATDEELYMFLQISTMYDLNPFMKEIWFVKNRDDSIMIMTARDGLDKIAKREHNFKWYDSWEVYENDDFEMELKMGEIVDIHHKIKQTDRGKLVGAYCVLQTTDGLTYGKYCDFDEYKRDSPVWRKNPSAMICKCAEVPVLKKFAKVDGVMAYEEAPADIQKMSDEIIDVEVIE